MNKDDLFELFRSGKMEEFQKACAERHQYYLKTHIDNNDFGAFQRLWSKGPDHWYHVSECLMLCVKLKRFAFMEEIVGLGTNFPLLIDVFENCREAPSLFAIFVRHWKIKKPEQFLEWMNACDDSALVNARSLLQKKQYSELAMLIDKERLTSVGQLLKANDIRI